MKALAGWMLAATLLAAPAWATPNATPDQGDGPDRPQAVENDLPQPPSERNEPVAPPPTDTHLEDEAATEPGTGGAGMEDPLDDRDIRHEPGQGGSGYDPDVDVDDENAPVPPPELTPPTDDPSIMGQERDGEGGAVFDTGDISGRQPGTIPEGSEPGPGSPMPTSEELSQ